MRGGARVARYRMTANCAFRPKSRFRSDAGHLVADPIGIKLVSDCWLP